MMIRISYWAKSHKRLAQATIVIISILMAVASLRFGQIFSESDRTVSNSFLVAAVTIYIAGIVFYPLKFLKRVKVSVTAFYRWQKAVDAVLLFSGLCMFFYIGSTRENAIDIAAVNATLPTSVHDSTHSYLSIKDFKASLRDEAGNKIPRKEAKKKLKQQVKNIKKANDLSPTAKTLLLILSIIGFMGLFYLALGLSCSLSCSGAEGAAVLVLIGGVGLSIFLLILAVRGIYGRKRKRKAELDAVTLR